MPNQKPDETFRVIDRRLFDSQGQIREEAAREERDEEPAPKPAAAPDSAPKNAATPRPPAAPESDAPAKPSRGFQMLVNFLAQNSAMLLGAYPDPRTGQAMVDLDGARELIDMLDALRETTHGNLAQEDDRLLLDVLGSLKLSYMEATKAAAKAMMKDSAKVRP